jgi:hypothetical protein
MAEGVTKNSTQPQILKVLDMCTSHISRESRDWVTTNASYENESGWLVNVNRFDDGWGFFNEPPDDIKKLLEFADSCGCCYILFDSGGPEYKQFDRFVW